MKNKKPCKYAEDFGGGWECTCYGKIYCEERYFDTNPDGSINAIMCMHKIKEKENKKNGILQKFFNTL